MPNILHLVTPESGLLSFPNSLSIYSNFFAAFMSVCFNFTSASVCHSLSNLFLNQFLPRYLLNVKFVDLLLHVLTCFIQYKQLT